MKSHNSLFSKFSFFKPSKLSASAILVVFSTTLAACAQTDTLDVADTSKTEPVSSKSSVAPITPITNPNLLKNVSATVYKDANCGCCKEWIDHAQDNGMSATGQDITDLAEVKQRYGVPDNMQSCHTAITTDGYVFEGHVPAKYMAQFLANPPAQALGLAVPGMPMGSPGMEYQDKFDPYQIMQINKDGSSEVYANIETTEQQL
ncbi:DUF411 domain-containing protein [Psychrobacter sp. M13]|uniref:DUF411 domain-containing protein n=1 Tax=Psychrobacter sp. M13 TaxID=3067275 RepID=UPI00273C47A0|nr:DUF411 domain-containing protein [Psychrobacter sp. M13]WLP93694.1 DUF411 domain-containing protein [Psychrobacter sp. M13]